MKKTLVYGIICSMLALGTPNAFAQTGEAGVGVGAGGAAGADTGAGAGAGTAAGAAAEMGTEVATAGISTATMVGAAVMAIAGIAAIASASDDDEVAPPTAHSH